jgi:hypothetical protein
MIKMIGKIMNKLGYYKMNLDEEGMLEYSTLDKLLEQGLFVVFEEDFNLIDIISTARANCKDIFIDYVKKSDTQKVYLNKKLVLEI